MSSIRETVLTAVAEQLGLNGKYDWIERPLRDLGLDSLKSLNLLLDLEGRLGAPFPEELLVAETFATAQSLISALERFSWDIRH